MAIRRLPLKELEEKCKDIFYDYLVNGKQFYSGSESAVDLGNLVDVPEGKTPMDMLYDETQATIKECESRVKFLQDILKEYEGNEVLTAIHQEQLDIVNQEMDLFKHSNMAKQKEYYRSTGAAEYSRSMVKIPLDKLINSYYDDLVLEVLFYDDIGVNEGQYDTYKSLETSEARLNFIKANTEITHIGLLVVSGNNSVRSIIAMQGKLRDDVDKMLNITALDSKFADFDKLTLNATMKIANNDLRQILQSKINLDKAKLELLAEKNVRGDLYKIYKNPKKAEDSFGYKTEELYIRYVCPSTGRVYYNTLNLTNLEYSDYFDKSNYESYIDAWWSLNNLGASVEGPAITRC